MTDLVKNITLDYLLQTPVGENFKLAIGVYDDLQKTLTHMTGDPDEDALTKNKIFTTLTLALLRKLTKEGKTPRDLSKDDWVEIAHTVSFYTNDMDGQEYSIFVFLLYADYIDLSVKKYEGALTKEKAEAISALSAEIRNKTALLKSGKIKEVSYIEDCLWICLEAMIKLLAGTFPYHSEEMQRFAEGTSQFAFEYGRYLLYRKERELVTEYLEKQKVLDEELQEKLDDYLELLEKRTENFRALIKNAFDPDFRDSLKASADLALATGVSKKDILSSKEEIDSYFLN